MAHPQHSAGRRRHNLRPAPRLQALEAAGHQALASRFQRQGAVVGRLRALHAIDDALIADGPVAALFPAAAEGTLAGDIGGRACARSRALALRPPHGQQQRGGYTEPSNPRHRRSPSRHPRRHRHSPLRPAPAPPHAVWQRSPPIGDNNSAPPVEAMVPRPRRRGRGAGVELAAAGIAGARLQSPLSNAWSM